MAIINGNDTIFGTLNGRQFFIDEAFEPDTAPQLPDWVPAQESLLDFIESQLPNIGTNYVVSVGSAWTAEPVYSDSTRAYIDGGIIWALDGSTAYEYNTHNVYQYALYAANSTTVKYIFMGYNRNTGKWGLGSTGQGSQYDDIRKNNQASPNRILSSLFVVQKGDNVTITNNVPDTSGYEVSL